MPTSKMPMTWNCFSRGTMPAGVICPCGVISRMLSPTRAPSERARSTPSTMPNSPARRFSSLPYFIFWLRCVSLSSCSGRMPRTITPCTFSFCDNMPWPLIKGAAAFTSGWVETIFSIGCHSLMEPVSLATCKWGVTPSMRARISF